MKKYMVADLVTDLKKAYKDELLRQVKEGIITIKDAQEDWAAISGYEDIIEFQVTASRSIWHGILENRGESKVLGTVKAELELESLGDELEDTPEYYVYFKMDDGKEYDYSMMDIDQITEWQDNPSATYYNSKIRQRPFPEPFGKI